MKENPISSPGTTEMLYGIDSKPPAKVTIPLAMQHVFAMFGATILVAILVNDGTGAEVLAISATIAMSGLGTLLYQFFTKGKSPVYLGSSFAFIAPLIIAYSQAGMAGAMTGVVVVGLVYIAFAVLIAIIGRGWINRLLPPIVIGPAILIIGLGLAPSAISQTGLDSGVSDWRAVVVTVVTVCTAIIVMTQVKGFFNVIPFLVAIVVGYVLAAILGMVDFAPVADAAWFAIPRFQFMFVDYMPILSALPAVVPAAAATIAEHIGDHKAISTIVDKDLLEDPGLHRTLLGDGFATLLAGLLGAPPNTTYGENTAVVGMTKCASTYVISWAACIAILLSCLGKFTAIISTIPNPVLGGVSLLLYGFIALNGVKVLLENHVSFNDMTNVAIAAPMLVIGLGNATIGVFSGMSLAALVGVALNLILNELFPKLRQLISK